MVARPIFEAGMLLAMEMGRELANGGRERVEERLRKLLSRAGLEPPTDAEIDVAFSVNVQQAAIELREIAHTRGLSFEDMQQLNEALWDALSAGPTQ